MSIDTVLKIGLISNITDTARVSLVERAAWARKNLQTIIVQKGYNDSVAISLCDVGDRKIQLSTSSHTSQVYNYSMTGSPLEIATLLKNLLPVLIGVNFVVTVLKARGSFALERVTTSEWE